MKNTIALVTLMILSLSVQASVTGVNGVYGPDNRQEVYQSKSELHKRLANSTAAMIQAGFFARTQNQNNYSISYGKSLEIGQNICPSEKFSNQVAVASCSGFLVSPDTMITAGHCYSQDPIGNCKKHVWVFDYDIKSANQDPTKSVSAENIYMCKTVARVYNADGHDFAIIKLDRKVVGREPLKFRKTGKINDTANLVTIGHPSGLPTKITNAGKITKNDGTYRFSTNLDTFHGNSGSAVFNSISGVIEGILIEGKPDYVPHIKDNDKSCKVVNTCDNNARNCATDYKNPTGPTQYGEVVYRITNIVNLIEEAIKL